MSTEFKNRVFGSVILKSINSNFNADFTHHPRTLPDGVVYSTDKALKFAIKDYFRKNYGQEKIFFVKRFDSNINPLRLHDTYKFIFNEYHKAKFDKIDKYSLFYFDGTEIKGVLPDKNKKEINNYFNSLEDTNELKAYSSDFNKYKKDSKGKKENEVKLENEGEDNEFYFYVDKNNKNIKLKGEKEELDKIVDELYLKLTGGVDKYEVLKNLLKCIDIRLFGATFADGVEKVNISLHGPVQINHGINKYKEQNGNNNEIYNEDILSPFADKEGAQMSTIGNQTNLKEGHYVFHFSINPKNTEEFYQMVNNGKNDDDKLCLSNDDINKLKEAMNNSVTALDSSRKIGTENEATIWVQLIENSKKVLPSFTELITVTKENDISIIDCTKVSENLTFIASEIEKVEVYYNPTSTKIIGFDENVQIKYYNILNNKELSNE